MNKKDIISAGAGAFLAASVGASSLTLTSAPPLTPAPAPHTQTQGKSATAIVHTTPAKTPQWIRRPRPSN